MIGIDTNTRLRLWLNDEPTQNMRIDALLAAHGDMPGSLRLTDVVSAEAVWTLTPAFDQVKQAQLIAVRCPLDEILAPPGISAVVAPAPSDCSGTTRRHTRQAISASSRPRQEADFRRRCAAGRWPTAEPRLPAVQAEFLAGSSPGVRDTQVGAPLVDSVKAVHAAL